MRSTGAALAQPSLGRLRKATPAPILRSPPHSWVAAGSSAVCWSLSHDFPLSVLNPHVGASVCCLGPGKGVSESTPCLSTPASSSPGLGTRRSLCLRCSGCFPAPPAKLSQPGRPSPPWDTTACTPRPYSCSAPLSSVTLTPFQPDNLSIRSGYSVCLAGMWAPGGPGSQPVLLSDGCHVEGVILPRVGGPQMLIQ